MRSSVRIVEFIHVKGVDSSFKVIFYQILKGRHSARDTDRLAPIVHSHVRFDSGSYGCNDLYIVVLKQYQSDRLQVCAHFTTIYCFVITFTILLSKYK